MCRRCRHRRDAVSSAVLTHHTQGDPCNSHCTFSVIKMPGARVNGDFPSRFSLPLVSHFRNAWPTCPLPQNPFKTSVVWMQTQRQRQGFLSEWPASSALLAFQKLVFFWSMNEEWQLYCSHHYLWDSQLLQPKKIIFTYNLLIWYPSMDLRCLTARISMSPFSYSLIMRPISKFSCIKTKQRLFGCITPNVSPFIFTLCIIPFFYMRFSMFVLTYLAHTSDFSFFNIIELNSVWIYSKTRLPLFGIFFLICK